MGFKNAFITGASSGLGRGLSLHYARAGATVYAAARRRAELESLAAEAAAAGAAGRVVPLVLDVADAEAQVAAIGRAEEESGGLDLVIANAGVLAPTPGRIIDWAQVKRVLDINVSAACVTLQHCRPWSRAGEAPWPPSPASPPSGACRAAPLTRRARPRCTSSWRACASICATPECAR